MKLDPHVYGGGFAWIEPFWDKDSKPTGSPKNGIYIHTIPKNPKVKTVEWYGFKDAEHPVKLKGLLPQAVKSSYIFILKVCMGKI
jgi:hypothetical protein